MKKKIQLQFDLSQNRFLRLFGKIIFIVDYENENNTKTNTRTEKHENERQVECMWRKNI